MTKLDYTALHDYTPRKQLFLYLHEKFHFPEEGRDKRSGAQPKPPSPKEAKKVVRRLRVTKNRLLNKVIFPDLADLIYFFEAMASDHKTQEEFEEEVKDLFGVGIGKPTTPAVLGDEIGTEFTRLISAVLLPENKNADYRLRLAHRLQCLVSEKVLFALRKKYDHNSPVYLSALEDHKRAISWTRFAAEMAPDSDKERDRRRIIRTPSLDERRLIQGTRSEERSQLQVIRNQLGIQY